jgi:hypothetical protein
LESALPIIKPVAVLDVPFFAFWAIPLTYGMAPPVELALTKPIIEVDSMDIAGVLAARSFQVVLLPKNVA